MDKCTCDTVSAIELTERGGRPPSPLLSALQRHFSRYGGLTEPRTPSLELAEVALRHDAGPQKDDL